MKKDTVSVIIPTYNRSFFLKDAVNSVLRQTYTDVEIIVVDDHSDVGHVQEVEKICESDPRIHLIRNTSNLGVSECRNMGLARATGSYLLFLDDDDELGEKILEKAMELFADEYATDVLIFPNRIHQKSSFTVQGLYYKYHINSLKAHVPRYRLINMTHFLLVGPMIHSMIFRKSAFAGRKFRPDLLYGEDNLLWIQMVKEGLTFQQIPDDQESGIAVFQRFHGINHLSSPPIDREIKYLETLKSQIDEIHQKDLSIINNKLLIRYLKKKHYKLMFTLLFQVFKNPVHSLAYFKFYCTLRFRVMWSRLRFELFHRTPVLG